MGMFIRPPRKRVTFIQQSLVGSRWQRIWLLRSATANLNTNRERICQSCPSLINNMIRDFFRLIGPIFVCFGAGGLVLTDLGSLLSGPQNCYTSSPGFWLLVSLGLLSAVPTVVGLVMSGIFWRPMERHRFLLVVILGLAVLGLIIPSAMHIADDWQDSFRGCR